jgi:DNA helicase-2/ATP-dependent DNA helicase PcrA
VAIRPPRTTGAHVSMPDSMSVSDLRDFKACPRRYEYGRRWRLPVRPSVQSWFGTLIHQVLHSASVQRRAGVTVTGDDIAAMWQQAWDTSRGPKGTHARLRLDGEQQLRRYVESEAWTTANIEVAEASFVIPLSQEIRLTGRFDRVDLRDDGVPTVVDYKTGRPRADDSLRKDLQVRAYAVAMSQRAEADKVAVELHYLQAAEVTRVVVDRKFLNTAYAHLSAASTELAQASAAGDFPPRPSRWQCPRCDFRTVCDEGRTAYPQ